MATVDISESSTLTPAAAWALASDLRRFDDWLTIFGGWRGPVPDSIDEGTEVSSLIKVKGFRNVIHWRVTGYDEPRRIALRGRGRGGIEIQLTMSVAEERAGSTFHLVAELRGGLLSGPVGRLVAKVLESDVRRSVRNLAALAPVDAERR
ncbi:SRPBCC family protein [Mycobacterium sp. ACS4331]|uniref:type II toxin-antitoxin system Rv0910 family toxin n=1 Tax=Mycobacterium sp. ACS4331 TaxID=1834121 RepID=UPI0007FD7656|nr:SRPBCC family protein [Mycobacterium sp. ACS4331]OBF17835.1 polyketide cyclase / dehydrase and lipid transport [Mycobacterium sp. ACS4331]